jgi:hypothetical protein
LSAEAIASRDINVKVDHLLNSKLMANLKNMDVQGPERYLTSSDGNRLTMEIVDNVIATETVDGDFVPEPDQVTLTNVIKSALQFANVDVGNFSQQLWSSVFWDPTFARPDKVTSYLNKVLDVNQGNHTVSKSGQYSETDDDRVNFGIKDLFNFGGSSQSETKSSATYDELYAWLLQHNYDVEIQGDIFIHRNLTLERVNLNALDRQETIFSKSVQLHHVDAPGTLRVSIGEKAVTENEDIAQLKRDLEGLRQGMDGLKQDLDGTTGRVGLLEPRVTQVEQNDNQMTDRMNGFDTALANVPDQTLSKLSGIPFVPTECTTHSTAMAPANDCPIGCLDAHDIRCSDNQILVQLHLYNGIKAGVRYDYTCCTIKRG